MPQPKKKTTEKPEAPVEETPDAPVEGEVVEAQPEAVPEAQPEQDAVLVYVSYDPSGLASVDIGKSGTVRITEIPTLLEMAVDKFRTDVLRQGKG